MSKYKIRYFPSGNFYDSSEGNKFVLLRREKFDTEVHNTDTVSLSMAVKEVVEE